MIIKLFFASLLFPAVAFMIFTVAMAIMLLSELVGLILTPLPVFYIVGVIFTYILLKEITE